LKRANGPGDDRIDAGTDGGAALFQSANSGVTVDLGAGMATGQGTDTLKDIDQVWGSPHDDTLIGDAGFSTFEPGPGDDFVDGAGGDDYVSYDNAPGPMTVNLATGTATGEGTDTLTNIDNVFGSGFADTLAGNAAANYLHGGQGSDTLSGGEGNDQFDGRA